MSDFWPTEYVMQIHSFSLLKFQILALLQSPSTYSTFLWNFALFCQAKSYLLNSHTSFLMYLKNFKLDHMEPFCQLRRHSLASFPHHFSPTGHIFPQFYRGIFHILLFQSYIMILQELSRGAGEMSQRVKCLLHRHRTHGRRWKIKIWA